MTKYYFDQTVDLLAEINPYFKAIPDEAVFSPEQVAQILNKSAETIRRWCRQQKLPSYCQGAYVILGNDLKQFLIQSRPNRFNRKIK